MMVVCDIPVAALWVLMVFTSLASIRTGSVSFMACVFTTNVVMSAREMLKFFVATGSRV
jgi:hypothetical protein